MASSDEQFSLCWNNFHANMSAGFHGLLSRGDLVDVTLAAEGRILQAHKLVLSVCSPYFQEMFKMNPNQHPIVFLKDVSHSALRDLLQFMYQGEVNVKQEELASFISTAEQLQVKGLTGNQNEESSTPSKPKPTSRPGPRSSQQRISAKLETDLDSKPSLTPVAIKRPNRPSIASNNSSSSQSGPAKRKCVDPLEAGPSGSTKDEFVTIPDEDENNAVAPKMEPEFVNESMWDDDDEGANNDETNFGEDDSNMEMSGFDGSATGDGNISGGGEGGAVGDAQGAEVGTFELGNLFVKFIKVEENASKINNIGRIKKINRTRKYMVHPADATAPSTSEINTCSLSESEAESIPSSKPKTQSKLYEKRRKRLINLGQQYVSKSGRIVDAKVMGESCECRYECSKKITHEQRLSCFNSFWALGNRQKQWAFVFKYTVKHKILRRLSQGDQNFRNFTYRYRLPIITTSDPNKCEFVSVCKTMFLNTLSVSGKIVKTAHEKFDGVAKIEKDLRGRRKQRNTTVNIQFSPQ
ncbi:protein tramtrack, beta isoform isoform X1 [Papilio machaon]|uniref:protein tramtrack, beta isoform isoform X1 n=1 Tax=Papilio machaon TaxID=76193 RepID=UPI001E666201|nr:protein tramtrack, beta isoform isoform X1 [Papilio machaon]